MLWFHRHKSIGNIPGGKPRIRFIGTNLYVKLGWPKRKSNEKDNADLTQPEFQNIIL